jgi:hypothetical protein
MKPEDLVKVLDRFADAGRRADLVAKQAVVSELKGRKARGHRIGVKGSRIVVAGPQAGVVAANVRQIAGKAGQKAVRGELP